MRVTMCVLVLFATSTAFVPRPSASFSRPPLSSSTSSHSPVRAAFDRHALPCEVRREGVLDRTRFRRVVRDLGTDLSRHTSDRLFALHGHEHNVTLREVHHLLDTADVTSPVRFFWLPLDPEDTGLRGARRKWNAFANAGLQSPTRLAHYGVGLLSLVVGTWDLVDYVLSFGTPAALTYDVALAHASLHCAVAFLSLPRFVYKWTPDTPWHLWMPTAREANMWPSFVLYSWYTSCLATDFVWPAHIAALSLQTEWFQALGWATTAVTIYGAARTVDERNHNTPHSGVYATYLSNVLQVSFFMTVPVLADTLKCAAVASSSSSPLVYDRYASLVAQHPEYGQIYAGAFLGAMYVGNLACALSSAEHYGAISKARLADACNALVAVTAAVSVGATLRIDEGRFAWEMVRVVWDGIW